MIALVLNLLLLIQGVPGSPAESGSVTGMLRDAEGKPAVGVRVAAMAKPEAPQLTVAGTELASIAETDKDGRFTLERIPVGSYYIVAGRVDYPTYYPSGQEIGSGKRVDVKPGTTTSGIDFAIADSSARLPGLSGFVGLLATPVVRVPTQIQIENGAKLPVFANGGFTVIAFTQTPPGNDYAEVLLNDSTANLRPTTPVLEYHVSVDNLPAGYVVKSITYGSTVLANGVLKVAAPSIAQPIGQRNLIIAFTSNTTGPSTFTSVGTLATGTLPPLPATSTPAPYAVPPTLTVAIGVTAVPASGLHVTGRLKDMYPREIYISGDSGILYDDGSFEFRNVSAGRHLILSPRAPSASSKPLALSVLVTDKDIDGVELAEIPVLPAGYSFVAEVPLVTLRARVFGKDGEPALNANVSLTGDGFFECMLDDEGRFEVPGLIPGEYGVEFQVPGAPRSYQTIVIGEQGLDINLHPKP